MIIKKRFTRPSTFLTLQIIIVEKGRVAFYKNLRIFFDELKKVYF